MLASQGILYKLIFAFVGVIMLALLVDLTARALTATPRSVSEVKLVEQLWGAIVPADAQSLRSSSTSYSIEISFASSPSGAERFTAAICPGQLHQAYDPFHAVDTVFPTSKSYMIRLSNVVYYSHSENASPTIWGGRCSPTPGGAIQVHQIVIDKSDPAQYRVRFENIGGSCATMHVPSCGSLGKNYIHPISDFPLLVVGLQETSNGFRLVGNAVCLDMSFTYASESIWDSGWDYLIGSQVEVALNDVFWELGIVTAQRRLVPVSIEESKRHENTSLWRYCTVDPWEPGTQVLSVVVETSDGAKENYRIEFVVDESTVG